MTTPNKELVKVSMQFAKEILPDDKMPFDPRSVFPPGEVDAGTNYQCKRIFIAYHFEKGMEWAIEHKDEDIPNLLNDAINKYVEDCNKDEKLSNLIRASFTSGVILYYYKSLNLPNGKTMKLNITYGKN